MAILFFCSVLIFLFEILCCLQSGARILRDAAELIILTIFLGFFFYYTILCLFCCVIFCF